jgi:hypothetical protein
MSEAALASPAASDAGTLPGASVITYRVRDSALNPERKWTLDGGQLSWREPRSGISGAVPLADIKCLRLRFMPTWRDAWRYSLRIYTRGGSRFTIPSTSHDNAWRVTDQREAFAGFVRVLHLRLHEANPDAACTAGSSPLAYGANAFLVGAGTMLALAALAVFLHAELYGLALTQLAVLLVASRPFYRLLRRNLPRPYQAKAIPPDVLPE